MTTKATLARITDPARREHFVYRAFDADGRLLYVGCSYRFERRLREHRAYGAEWLRHVVRYRLVGPYNFQTAREIEAQALGSEKPLYGSTPVRRGHGHRRAMFNRRLWDEARDLGLVDDDVLSDERLSKFLDRRMAEWDAANPHPSPEGTA